MGRSCAAGPGGASPDNNTDPDSAPSPPVALALQSVVQTPSFIRQKTPPLSEMVSGCNYSKWRSQGRFNGY
jgi:hypothetical protein